MNSESKSQDIKTNVKKANDTLNTGLYYNIVFHI